MTARDSQATEVDVHDPAGMAAFMRERARCSREFLKLTSEEQIRQFMESWQRNVLPHFAFRFEQGAELIERLERENETLRLAFFQLTDFAAQQWASVTRRIRTGDVPDTVSTNEGVTK